MDTKRKTKVHKVELLIVNTDNVTEESIISMIENARYPNHCIDPQVKHIETREVDWNDDHPLNKQATSEAAYQELFGK
jgi:hypothetical protein